MSFNNKLFGLLLFSVFSSSAIAGGVIPVSNDFQVIGEQSRTSRVPVLVVFAAEDCGFCDRLEEDHLAPMAKSLDYNGKVIIRKVMIDSYAAIKGFDGEATSGEDLADHYGVRVTPTVMLFSDSGDRLSKKLIGYNGNAYYGWDLDKLIEDAGRRLNKSL